MDGVIAEIVQLSSMADKIFAAVIVLMVAAAFFMLIAMIITLRSSAKERKRRDAVEGEGDAGDSEASGGDEIPIPKPVMNIVFALLGLTLVALVAVGAIEINIGRLQASLTSDQQAQLEQAMAGGADAGTIETSVWEK